MRECSQKLPDGLLLAYYGDDFTGSTDVMEAFSAAGLSTVLFLRLPLEKDLARFKEVRCIGFAGQSRGKSPAWMQQHLPPVFQHLAALGAPILQYKVCSTFDSSPAIGSIGQAIDLGIAATRSPWSPMVIGAPRLKRYQVFGNLFAAVDGVTYRIDRHPTMSRHPVTPMNEADLGVHLSKQTTRRIVGIDVADVSQGAGQGKLEASIANDEPIIMIDVADSHTQIEAGRLIWENCTQQLFSASSSGLQYALTAYWRSKHWIPQDPPPLPIVNEVDCIVAVSGSCSPVGAEQLKWARSNGFETFRLDIAKALNPLEREMEIDRLSQLAQEALTRKTSPIIYSAEGPDDPAVTGFDLTASDAMLTREQAAEEVGKVLAEIMRCILDHSTVRRLVVAGGDSSGAVGSHLGIIALTVAAGIAPGVPLCRAWSDDPNRDGLEVALKGGQMGGIDFYGQIRAGRPSGS